MIANARARFGSDAGAGLHRPSRRDALPEHTSYVDSGCEVHPSCLTCPLARCRYDEPGGLRAMLGAERDRRMVRAYRDEHLKPGEVARRFGVSRRTVFRVMQKARDSEET